MHPLDFNLGEKGIRLCDDDVMTFLLSINHILSFFVLYHLERA